MFKNISQIFCYEGNIIKQVGREGGRRKSIGHTRLTLKGSKTNNKVNSTLAK